MHKRRITRPTGWLSSQSSAVHSSLIRWLPFSLQPSYFLARNFGRASRAARSIVIIDQQTERRAWFQPSDLPFIGNNASRRPLLSAAIAIGATVSILKRPVPRRSIRDLDLRRSKGAQIFHPFFPPGVALFFVFFFF